jgi:hypothetical protein
MTVAELIEALKRFDPSDVVCVNDQEITPASDEVMYAEIGGYHCAVLNASTWPGDVEAGS